MPYPATNDIMNVLIYVLIGVAAVCAVAAVTLIYLKLKQKRK